MEEVGEEGVMKGVEVKEVVAAVVIMEDEEEVDDEAVMMLVSAVMVGVVLATYLFGSIPVSIFQFTTHDSSISPTFRASRQQMSIRSG